MQVKNLSHKPQKLQKEKKEGKKEKKERKKNPSISNKNHKLTT